MFNPAPNNRLLNLTGFFSSSGAAALTGAVDIFRMGSCAERGPDQGIYGASSPFKGKEGERGEGRNRNRNRR